MHWSNMKITNNFYYTMVQKFSNNGVNWSNFMSENCNRLVKNNIKGVILPNVI